MDGDRAVGWCRENDEGGKLPTLDLVADDLPELPASKISLWELVFIDGNSDLLGPRIWIDPSQAAAQPKAEPAQQSHPAAPQEAKAPRSEPMPGAAQDVVLRAFELQISASKAAQDQSLADRRPLAHATRQFLGQRSSEVLEAHQGQYLLCLLVTHAAIDAKAVQREADIVENVEPRQQHGFLENEPDIAALISTTPQAQRLLRPLCHILGVRHASLGVRHASLGIKPKALNLPLPRAGLGCKADQRRGLSRSDGKGELRASTRALGAQPQLTSPPLLVGLGCKADQRRGPSRSDGKGEGRAVTRAPAATPPSPLPGFRAWAAKSRPRQGEGAAPGIQPDPYANLCPRLRTRWPFNQLPQFRQA